MYECRAMLNNIITSRFRITYYIFYQMLKLFASWFCRNTGKSLRIFFFRWQFQRSETNRTPALDEPKKAPLEVPLSVSRLEQTHPAFYSLSPPAYTAIPDVTSGNQSQQKPLFNKSWYETVFTLICDVLVKFHLKCEKQSLESLKVIHFWLVPMCHKIFRFFFFNFTINKKK